MHAHFISCKVNAFDRPQDKGSMLLLEAKSKGRENVTTVLAYVDQNNPRATKNMCHPWVLKATTSQMLTGMLEILVMGSIFSTQPMLTSGIQSAL